MIKYLNSPYRTKYKFYHFRLNKKGRKGIYNIKKNDVSMKIKSKVSWIMTPRQIEVIRRMFAKRIKMYLGIMSILIFPDLPKAKKPLGFRMGKGKGKFYCWVAPIKTGQNILSFSFFKGTLKKIKTIKRRIYLKRKKRILYYKRIKEINKRVAYRLPVYTKIECKQKKKQNYNRIWKMSNIKRKNDISRYLFTGNR
jgi:ribosomal protein L16/L10AE